jgi:hypothetical protein
MSAGLDLRKRVVRKEPVTRAPKLADPFSSIDSGTPGEVRVSSDTMVALQHLYNTSPSIQAARAILQGQLLSSGCVVRRAGKDVPLKETFSRHLAHVWLPFARGVIDSFLMFGFVVVTLEEEGPPPFANFLKGKEIAAVSSMGPVPADRKRKDPPDTAGARARKSPVIVDAKADAKVSAAKINSNANLVPLIPDLGQYEVSFNHSGPSGYRRTYSIFATNSDSVYRQDFSSEIFFKTEPDSAGNIVSPIATVFQGASFISALEELALQAEVVRARQLLVTQPAVRQHANQNLDPANLFFDSESRAVQASAAAEDDAAQAQSLAMQAKMMAMINRLQTTDPQTGRERPGTSSAATHIPPPIPPQLFAAPDRQQIVPGVRPPEARSDLVDLMRVMNDHSEILT